MGFEPRWSYEAYVRRVPVPRHTRAEVDRFVACALAWWALAPFLRPADIEAVIGANRFTLRNAQASRPWLERRIRRIRKNLPALEAWRQAEWVR